MSFCTFAYLSAYLTQGERKQYLEQLTDRMIRGWTREQKKALVRLPKPRRREIKRRRAVARNN